MRRLKKELINSINRLAATIFENNESLCEDIDVTRSLARALKWAIDKCGDKNVDEELHNSLNSFVTIFENNKSLHKDLDVTSSLLEALYNDYYNYYRYHKELNKEFIDKVKLLTNIVVDNEPLHENFDVVHHLTQNFKICFVQNKSMLDSAEKALIPHLSSLADIAIKHEDLHKKDSLIISELWCALTGAIQYYEKNNQNNLAKNLEDKIDRMKEICKNARLGWD